VYTEIRISGHLQCIRCLHSKWKSHVWLRPTLLIIALSNGSSYHGSQSTLAPMKLHATRLSPALLNSQVCVDAGIAGCACEILVLAVGNVDVGLGVTVLFG